MQKNIFRKGLVLGIIFLFLGAGVVPSISGDIGRLSNASDIEEKSEMSSTLSAPIWQWAKNAGGNSDDFSSDICVDFSENSYVTGTFHGTAVFGSHMLTSIGGQDIFVAKLDPNGNWLWAVNAGGPKEGYGTDLGVGISIDPIGNIYITGIIYETAYFGLFTLPYFGGQDIFVAKLDPNGNWLWAVSAGGSAPGYSTDMGLDISVDSNGNSYVTGIFLGSADFGPYQLPGIGSEDVFVAKLDTNGNWLWVKQAGGNEYDGGSSISVDSNVDVYISGVFKNSATFGSFTPPSFGGQDIFVAKLDTNGNWQWAKSAGGTSDDIGEDICVDSSGNSYVTGEFWDTATFGSYILTSIENWDIYVTKLDTNGNWQWAKSAGGPGEQVGYGICLDSDGNSYITGFFLSSVNFDSYFLYSSGDTDVYIAKLDKTGATWLWAEGAGGTSGEASSDIAVDSDGSTYITGYIIGSATFGSFILTSFGTFDVFVAKLSKGVYPESKICCEGSLIWKKVKGNTTVNGTFQVCNCGYNESLLNWEVSSYPDWGTWTFTPSNGTGLAAGDCVTIYVEVIAPAQKKKTFTGKIVMDNLDNESDVCEIDVSLTTPRTKTIVGFNLLQLILQKYTDMFPILRKILV